VTALMAFLDGSPMKRVLCISSIPFWKAPTPELLGPTETCYDPQASDDSTFIGSLQEKPIVIDNLIKVKIDQRKWLFYLIHRLEKARTVGNWLNMAS